MQKFKIKFLLITIFFLLIASFSFSDVVDNAHLFTKSQVESLNQKIEEFEKVLQVNYKFYTINNSNQKDKDQIIKEANTSEKTVFIIFDKKLDNKLVVGLKITNDIDISGYRDQMESVIKDLKDDLTSNNIYKAADKILTSLSNFLTSTTKNSNENNNQNELEKPVVTHSHTSVNILIFLLLLIIIIYFIVRYKKKSGLGK